MRNELRLCGGYWQYCDGDCQRCKSVTYSGGTVMTTPLATNHTKVIDELWREKMDEEEQE